MHALYTKITVTLELWHCIIVIYLVDLSLIQKFECETPVIRFSFIHGKFIYVTDMRTLGARCNISSFCKRNNCVLSYSSRFCWHEIMQRLVHRCYKSREIRTLLSATATNVQEKPADDVYVNFSYVIFYYYLNQVTRCHHRQLSALRQAGGSRRQGM